MHSTRKNNAPWKLLGLLLVGLWAAMGPYRQVQAQTINVSLADTAALAGEEILVPLLVSPLSESDNVLSGTFVFNSNESIFEITGVEKQGAMLENTSSILFNIGTNTLAFASTSAITGTGTLVYLKVKAKNEVSYFQYTDVSITQATLNEGEPEVNATGARWTIKGIRIEPRSQFISIIEGDSLQFNLSGYIEPPVIWSVTDTTIGTIDETGMFRSKRYGLVQVKAADGQGLRDSTAFFRVQSSVINDLAVTIPDTSVRQTRDIALPVYVSDVTGLGVLSTDLQITYNPNYVQFNGVSAEGTMTEAWGAPTVRVESGAINIASAGTDTLEGFGTLYFLNFSVKDINTGSFNLNINRVKLNEDLSVATNNGRFTVLAKPVINLNIPDTAVSTGEQLSFEVSGGEGTAPYIWEVDDSSIASMDANSGLFTGLNRGDALVNAVDAQNFKSGLVNVRVNDFDATLDSIRISYPDSFTVALRTTGDLAPFNVLSFTSEFSYDTTKLKFLGLETDGTQSDGASAEATLGQQLKIAVAGTSYLGGTDPLVYVHFAPKEAVQHLDEIALYLDYLTFDEPGPTVPTTTSRDGEVNIIRVDPPLTPVLSTPLAGAVNQDTSLVLDWEASQDAAEYQVQLATDSLSSGLMVDSMLTATQLSVDGLEYLTTYYWRVRASNLGGESEWSGFRSFTTVIEAPVVPTLVSPEDSLTRVQAPISFLWNAADRAETYGFELSAVEDFSTPVVEESVSDTSLEVSDLDPFTRYYWRVQSVNAGGESSYSVARTFETAAIPASVPVLLSPANEAADLDTALTLIFSSAPGAVSYEYQLSDTTDFSRLVADGSGTETTTAVTGLDYLTNYYWRARVIGAQDTSDWSAAFSFTTKTKELVALATPIQLLPAKDSTGTPRDLNFVWSSVKGADRYNFELRLDTSSVFLSNTTKDTTISYQNLINGTTFYWRIQSADSATARVSDWSSWFGFTVEEVQKMGPIRSKAFGTQIFSEDFEPKNIVKLDTMYADPDGLPLEFEVVTGQNTPLVNASIDSANVLNFTSIPDTNGIGQLVLKVTDQDGLSLNDTLDVVVVAVNDAPVLSQIPDTLSFPAGQLFEIYLDSLVFDVDDDFSDLNIEASIDTAVVFLSFDPSANKVSILSPAYEGLVHVDVRITDPDGEVLEFTIVLAIGMVTSNEDLTEEPKSFTLQQNYPNPFNPSTHIQYSLPEATKVRLEVFNNVGQKVATLVNARQSAGEYTVRFDASGVSSGIYLYKITTPAFSQTKKMLLIK